MNTLPAGDGLADTAIKGAANTLVTILTIIGRVATQPVFVRLGRGGSPKSEQPPSVGGSQTKDTTRAHRTLRSKAG